MKRTLLFLLGCLAISCSNSEPDSLQEYMAAKTQAPDYMAVDFDPSMFKGAANNLSTAEENALSGIDKLNVVAYHSDSIPPAFYKAETERIKKLLTNDPQYQELIHVNSGKDGGSVSFVGDEKHIDELVIFGKHHENGFAIVRVIGKDMKPETVVSLLKVIRERGLGIKELQPIQQAVDPTRTFKG